MAVIINGTTGVTFADNTIANSAITVTDSSWSKRRIRFDFEGTNSDTYTFDYAGKVMNPLQNSATISTAQKKFGSSSLLCSGGASSASQQLPVSLVQPVGTNDFTLECWAYVTSFTNNGFPAIVDLASSTALRIGFYFTSATACNLRLNATNNALTTASIGISLNTWFHFCIERVSNTLYLYIDGTPRGTFAYTTSITNSYVMNIGSTTDGYPLAGYIDDFRFTTGTAVYNPGAGLTFTPPTAALPIGAYNLSGIGTIGL